MQPIAREPVVPPGREKKRSAALDRKLERSYSTGVARNATPQSDGATANAPSRPFRRQPPSAAEQARREQWGNTVGALVKQAYTESQGAR